MTQRSYYSPLLPLLALVPAFLGGGNQPWSLGFTLLIFGLLIIVCPPRHSLGRALNGCLLGLLLCAGTAFLPAKWFGIPQWRAIAVEDLGIPLGPFITPQPWLTLEGFVILAAGAIWLYYVCIQPVGFNRSVAAKLFCATAAVLACVSLYFYFSGNHWPYERSIARFGPFTSKNQSGDLFAVAALLTLGCIYEDFREGNPSTGTLWIVVLGLLLTALVLSASKAAVALFFLGVIIWFVCLARVARSKGLLAVGVGIVLVFLSLFFMGDTFSLERFVPYIQGTETVTSDLRWHIQKNALSMYGSSPWVGIGLGNFEGEFRLVDQTLNSTQHYILHPESDWVWLLVEMGLPGLILVIGGTGLLATHIFPLNNEPTWRLRAAAAAGGIVFALHGFVDVSAHTIGSAFPGLFVFSLALHFRDEERVGGWFPACFRGVGLCFALLGAALVGSSTGLINQPIPSSASVKEAIKQATILANKKAYPQAVQITTQALNWAPLEWQLYYHRAIATALGTPDYRSALADFRRSDALSPVRPLPESVLNEGRIWLLVKPTFTLPAWRLALNSSQEFRVQFYRQMAADAVRHPELAKYIKVLANGEPDLDSASPGFEIEAKSWEDRRILLFNEMYADTAGRPDLRAGVISIANGQPDLELLLLGQCSPQEFPAMLAAIFQRDPELASFSLREKRSLFGVWIFKGDPLKFVSEAEKHPAWMPAALPALVQCYAANGEYKRAYEMAHDYVPVPVLPELHSILSADELEKALYVNPGNFADGYALYELQMKGDAIPAALATLEKLTEVTTCPSYFFYLKANLYARQAKWKEAWEALYKSNQKLLAT